MVDSFSAGETTRDSANTGGGGLGGDNRDNDGGSFKFGGGLSVDRWDELSEGRVVAEEFGRPEGQRYQADNPVLSNIGGRLGGWLGGIIGGIAGGGFFSPVTGQVGAWGGSYAGSKVGQGGWYTPREETAEYDGGDYIQLDDTDRRDAALVQYDDAPSTPPDAPAFGPSEPGGNLAPAVALGMVGAVALAIAL